MESADTFAENEPTATVEKCAAKIGWKSTETVVVNTEECRKR
jgi:hypothetical protein